MKDTRKEDMLQILDLKKDQRYRRGLLQAYVVLGVITQNEWEHLDEQISNGVKSPSLPNKQPIDNKRAIMPK